MRYTRILRVIGIIGVGVDQKVAAAGYPRHYWQCEYAAMKLEYI